MTKPQVREPLDITTLMPADTPLYMFDMWFGCIHFALGQEEIVEQFRKDTGNNWQPGRNGLERMIDEATGVDRDFVEQFIRWVNVNIWGPIDGPKEEAAS